MVLPALLPIQTHFIDQNQLTTRLHPHPHNICLNIILNGIMPVGAIDHYMNMHNMHAW